MNQNQNPRAQALPLAALPAVFGVSAMSVYLWRQGTPTKDALEEPYTPARLRSWAKKNGRTIAKEPEAVLAKWQKDAAKKAGRPPTTSKKKKEGLKRNGAGRVTGARPAAKAKRAGDAVKFKLARQLAGGGSSLGI